MDSSVDEQPPEPPGPPSRPRPPAARRRPPSRAEVRAAQRQAAAPPARRRTRPPARASGDDDGAPAPAPRNEKRTVVLLSVATALVVLLAGVAIAVSTRSSRDSGPKPAPENTPEPVVKFTDPTTGFSVEYPKAWRRVEVPVAEYRLAVDGGNNVAFTIRVVPIATPADASNLANFKAVTDGLVGSNSTVTVLKQQAIQLNGMIGYYYFYTFTDGVVQAVHAHYFLFSGNKMNILVFQTLPDDFESMAAKFDKIAESFRSDPNVGAQPSTTAPAPTTTTTTAG